MANLSQGDGATGGQILTASEHRAMIEESQEIVLEEITGGGLAGLPFLCFHYSTLLFRAMPSGNLFHALGIASQWAEAQPGSHWAFSSAESPSLTWMTSVVRQPE